ncbi:hypothetical protein T4B_15143, partial [Trichinella pseudospiralis]|uniref:Uncharacterized protein n=2 Tax=Trichinella pseudospiralis TaxID=6337 RepID=A0A0V1FDN6_TRIPS
MACKVELCLSYEHLAYIRMNSLPERSHMQISFIYSLFTYLQWLMVNAVARLEWHSLECEWSRME